MYNSISSRRDFIKKMAQLSAITAAAAMFPGIVFASEQEAGIPEGTTLDWKKGPCRFCGVGCGILVGTENGKAVAEYLANHPKIEKVYWPGFASHPNHEIAKS